MYGGQWNMGDTFRGNLRYLLFPVAARGLLQYKYVNNTPNSWPYLNSHKAVNHKMWLLYPTQFKYCANDQQQGY